VAASLLFVHERADGLAGALEGTVGRVNLDLGHQRGRKLVQAASTHFVLQGLLQVIPDRSLGVGAANVQGYGVDMFPSQLRAQQNETYLRSIAMGDDHRPTGFDQVDNMTRGFLNGPILVGNRLMGVVLDQGVASHRYHG